LEAIAVIWLLVLVLYKSKQRSLEFDLSEVKLL
jgi:hypothetical protein